jgi:hypothetical protein
MAFGRTKRKLTNTINLGNLLFTMARSLKLKVQVLRPERKCKIEELARYIESKACMSTAK